jgi:hypothetical protein
MQSPFSSTGRPYWDNLDRSLDVYDGVSGGHDRRRKSENAQAADLGESHDGGKYENTLGEVKVVECWLKVLM